MNLSTEEFLLSELKQICRRLGEAAAGIETDLGGSKLMIDGVSADLDELRRRLSDHAGSST